MPEIFHVGRRNGRICTRSWLPRDSPTVVRLAVAASDSVQSAAVAVEITIERGSCGLRQESFESGFYSVDVAEDVPVGYCILTVSEDLHLLIAAARADWAAWMLATCQVGAVNLPARWAATSNVEGGSETRRPRGPKGRLYSDKLFAAPPPRVPSYATAHGAGLPS